MRWDRPTLLSIMCCRKTPHDDHGGVEPCCARCYRVCTGTQQWAGRRTAGIEALPVRRRTARRRCVDIPTTRARSSVNGNGGCAAGAVPAGFRARRRFRGPFPSLPRAVWRTVCMRRYCADDGWPSYRAHLKAGCDGDRGAGEGGAEAEGSEAEAAQAGAATQGRGAGEGAEPAGTATDDEPSADAGGPASAMSAASATPRAIPSSGTSCRPPMAGSPSAAS